MVAVQRGYRRRRLDAGPASDGLHSSGGRGVPPRRNRSGLARKDLGAGLEAHRRDVLNPKITAYHGRIVRTATDGMIVEFLSVVDAVRCAADVQRCMADHIHMLEDLRKAGCEG